MIDLIKRNECVLSNQTLNEFCCFPNFPIYMGCVDSNPDEDIFADMKWGYSEQSGLVQLMKLIPLEVLYSLHHNPGVTGKTWEQHHLKFSELIKTVNFKSVLEIGGATGILLSHFLSSAEDFKWSVLEPSGVLKIDDNRIEIIKDYFENYKAQNKHDVIVHSHVLEHIYDPMNFMRLANDILVDGGYQFISIPNIKHWLSQGYANALMFEHTYYIDEYVLEYILNENGFVIEDKIVDEHSIIVKSKKVNHKTKNICNFEYSKLLFENYYSNLKKQVEDISEKIKDKKVYIFGAHVFSQMYLNMGLPEDNIISILDNNEGKQGKRLYGTNLTVNSPNILRNDENPIVILKAGAYSEEIKTGIIKLNPSTIFY